MDNLELMKTAFIYEGVEKVIAEKVGPVVNPNMPVPVTLDLVCNNMYADPGETCWYPTGDDTDDDEIYTWDTTNGILTTVKRSVASYSGLTFTGLQSKAERVLLADLLGSKDQGIFTRKTAKIINAADKQEVRAVLAAINASGSVQDYAKDSSEDLYDVAAGMMQKLSKYGTDYVWLCGNDVYDALQTYDKDQAGTLQYNVTLMDQLVKWGIKAVKIIDTAKVKTTGDVTAQSVLAAKRSIMFALNSAIREGKPVDFIRRRIPAEIAALLGGTVQDNYRALVVNKAAVQDGSGNNIAGFDVFAIESVGISVVRAQGICKNSVDLV